MRMSPFERSKRVLVTFDRAGVPAFGHLNITALGGRYEQRLDQDRLPGPGRPRRIDRADIDGSDVQLRGVLRTSLGPVRLTSGADQTNRPDLHAHDIAIVFDAAGTITSTIVNASIASARRRDTGAFAQAEAPIGARITASADLTEVVLTLNGVAVQPRVTQQDDHTWLIVHASGLPAGSHRAHLLARDQQGRAGGFGWQFEVAGSPRASPAALSPAR